MHKQVILCFVLAVTAQAASQKSARNRASADIVGSSTPSSLSLKEPATPVPILRQINEILEDGSYRFGYEGGDGSFRIETRQPDGTVRGKYGFRDADGQIRVVDYSATNETGFDAQGEHIPKGPPPARAQPSDFEEEEERAFTTQRPRPRTRPSPRPRPQEIPQPRQKPRPRPRPRPTTTPPPPPPPPPPPVVQNDAFAEDFDDEAQAFLLQQGFAPSRPRARPPTPTVITHQAPVRRPQTTTSRRPVFVPDQSFEFESAEESPRAVTAVQQSGGRVAAARPSSSGEREFASFDRPFSSSPRRPSRPPTAEDFLFPSGFQPPRSPPTSRRPKPRPQVDDAEPVDDFDTDEFPPPRASRPPVIPQHQLPPVHVPQQPRIHENRQSGSFIDDFLATHPPPPPRPAHPPRRPVFEDSSFDGRDRERQRESFDFRDRSRQRSRQRDRFDEARKAVGTSHGFVFQAKPSGDGLDDNVQLIQTVPGSRDTFFQNLGF